MTDFSDYTDADILESVELATRMAAMLLADHNNPLTVSAETATADAYQLIADAHAGLKLVRERRSKPTNVVLWAAEQRVAGAITDDEFTEVMSRETLRHQGIAEPTDEQIAWRVAELNTANSFVSSVDRGE
ncbi:hypothetical protein ACXDF8_11515 [Mycolicibacterium sp. CBM1]